MAPQGPSGAIIGGMRIALLGLGLIGGSIARALRSQPAPGWTIAAWTPDGSGPRAARAAGVIEHAAPRLRDAVAGADLVVLAAPPLACLELLTEISGPLRDALAADAVVTDVASTKAAIVAQALSVGLRFVGGHPMAGRETSGFGAADAGLFLGRPWVVVPSADEAAIARVEALAVACGAHPLRMEAYEHDEAVAGISHLPLLLAAALVDAVAGRAGEARPDWLRASGLAATGWDGMTRLARGDVTMGTEILASNAPAIAARVRTLRAVLDEWLALLETTGGVEVDGIRARLAAAKTQLEG